MSGPASFLARLRGALDKHHLPPHRIANAADVRTTDHPNGVILIGRFDGLFMYRFTPAALYNFVRANKIGSLPRMSGLETSIAVSLQSLDRLIAAYFNRRDWPLKRRADAIVYQSRLSHRIHQTFAQPDPAATPVYEIANGVPLDIFRSSAKAALRTGGPHLAITAQFRVGKRLRDAVQITNALRRTYPLVRLHVIGDIDLLARESIEGLDISACELHGRVRSETLPDLYSSMEIGLSPALFDPCPNSVIEMLACGLPVLTTAASGAAELVPDAALTVAEDVALDFVENHNFRRFPTVGIEAWCTAIEAVLDRRALWREICLEHARRTFDIDVVARRYAEVIEVAWEARKLRRGLEPRPT